MPLNGIRNLWAGVINHALEAATANVPELPEDYPPLRFRTKKQKLYVASVRRQERDRARARRFFEDPNGTSNLKFACLAIDMPVGAVSAKGLRLIRKAKSPLHVRAGA